MGDMKLLTLVIGCLAVVHGNDSIDYIDVDLEVDIEEVDEPTGVLASVREYPWFLHKCTATFVNEQALVTSAKCLLCTGSCKFYVAVVDKHLEDSKVSVHEVEKFLIHPRFWHDTSNDIAIIKLKENVPNAPVHSLPSPDLDIAEAPGHVFSWLFAEDMKNFTLVSKDVLLLTSELCSYYLSEYVQRTYVCAHGQKHIVLGPADHGSPVLYDDGIRGTIVGTFTRPGIVDDEIVLYTSIFPFLKWIQDNIDPYPHHATTTRRPHYKKVRSKNKPHPRSKITMPDPKTTTKPPPPTTTSFFPPGP